MKSSLNFALTTLSLLTGLLSVPTLADEPTGQVIGFYSKGKLKNSSELSMTGPGFIHLFQERERHFGSEGMIELIEKAASQFYDWDSTSERLQVGDIAAKRGGLVSRHASHQNGLDVDLVYFRTNHNEQSPDHTNGFEEKFVTGKGNVTSNFDTKRNWFFLQLLLDSGRLDRIFVDPAIKREFCAFAKAPHGDGSSEPQGDPTEALRRLRPYPNHADHWHIRLTCPSSSPKCIPQAALPPGDGCGSIEADLFTAALMELDE